MSNLPLGGSLWSCCIKSASKKERYIINDTQKIKVGYNRQTGSNCRILELIYSTYIIHIYGKEKTITRSLCSLFVE